MFMKNPAIFRLHLIVFLWGFTAIIGKLISGDASMIVFYRMLFATFFLFVFIRFVKKRSLRVSKQLFFQLIGIGGLVALHWLCFFQSIKVANVSIALSCLALSTLFASIIEPIVFKRKVDITEVILGVVIVICIAMIFNIEFQYKEGIFFGTLAALLGTIFSVFNGKIYGRTTSANIIFYEIFGGWFLIMLFFLFSGQLFQFDQLGMRDFWLLLVLAGVFTAYPMMESVDLMKHISPFTLILTVNLEPVYGIILAFLIFGESEQMSPLFYGASLVMILAIFLNGLLKSRRAKQKQKLNI